MRRSQNSSAAFGDADFQKKRPNKAPEPTPTAVTSPANERIIESSQRIINRRLQEPRRLWSWLIFDVGQSFERPEPMRESDVKEKGHDAELSGSGRKCSMRILHPRRKKESVVVEG